MYRHPATADSCDEIWSAHRLSSILNAWFIPKRRRIPKSSCRRGNSIDDPEGMIILAL